MKTLSLKTAFFLMIFLLGLLACENDEVTPKTEIEESTSQVAIKLYREQAPIVSVHGARISAISEDYYTLAWLFQFNPAGYYDQIASGVWYGTPDSLLLALTDTNSYYLMVKQIGTGESNYGIRTWIYNGEQQISGHGFITNRLVYGEESFWATYNSSIDLYVNPDSMNTERYYDYDVYFEQVFFQKSNVPSEIELYRWQNGAEINLINSNPNVFIDLEAEWWYEPIRIKNDTTFYHQFTHRNMAGSPTLNFSDHTFYNIKIWQNIIIDGDTLNSLIYDGNPEFSRLEKILIEIDMANSVSSSSVVNLYEQIYQGDTLQVGS
ncbi:hypothetical protein [Marinoscillum sp. MHG1-6]|uniref:hypothetical protein n=1 Tax=Marinoscillum sp. MHG1-6 TaxID=2959627 RepID=UPI0021585DA7|nr:hypothetical protein [Marinoscillum sp. MHG1-6]